MRDLIFKKIFIPFYHYIYRNNSRVKAYKKLIRRDLLSYDDLLFIQWKKLKKLINYCYKTIPYYQKLFNSLDLHPLDIKTLKDYRSIPEFNKLSIVENKNELINPELAQKNLIINYTTGSMGIPAKIYRSLDDQENICALRARSNSWCGWNLWDKTFCLLTDQRYIKQADSLTGEFSVFLNRKNIADTKNVCPERMFSWVKQIRKFKPNYLYGYSSLLEEFSVFLTNENINIEGLKGIFSTVEPLIQRELISNAFKAPVYDEYGCSEVPCIAHECQKGSMHINIDEVLVEFEEAEGDFEAKKLICTPLYLYGMPILRYNTEDTALIKTESDYCDCGLAYPAIKLRVSKGNDNLISSNGKLVSGVVIASYIPAVTSGIKQFQIVQKDLLSIKVKISNYEGPVEENERNIRKLLYELMDTSSIKVNFEYYEEIPPDINGNLRPVISNIESNLSYKANIRAKTLN